MKISNKIHLFLHYTIRLLRELFVDVLAYYKSPYPLLLILGTFRRIRMRYKVLFLPKGKGRPPIEQEIVDLILEMKKSNWRWGALRISQELALLGISIHKKTISKILKDYGVMPPQTKVAPPTWKSLISCYSKVWAMDFLSVVDWLGTQLFILVIIDQNSRELIWISATYTPNRNWLSQQFRNIAIDGVDFPQALIMDNDPIYGKWLKPFLNEQFGVKRLKIPPRSPWCNGVCERVNKTIQLELLDRIPVTIADEALSFLSKYKSYYNDLRPHQGIGGQTPSGMKTMPSERSKTNELKYIKTTHIDGLFTEFSLVA